MPGLPTSTLAPPSQPPRTPISKLPGHPLLPRDIIEAGTFSRDILLAQAYNLPPTDAILWLATRARARRDLLWACRHVFDYTRLSERIHRPPANFSQRIFTTPHSFGSNRDPRGNGKTSLATFGGGLWCVIQDPIECIQRGWPIRGRESRLGITTLKREWSEALLAAFLLHLEGDQIRYFFPEIIPDEPKKWGQQGIILHRQFKNDVIAHLADHPLFTSYPEPTKWPDPTFAPGSLEAGRAGAHTNGEIIDDPVNEKTWNSPPAIRTAVDAIRQCFNIARNERGFILVTGNHWCPGDVADTLDLEDGGCGWEVFLRDGEESCEECKDGFPTDERGMVPRDPKGDWLHTHRQPTFVWMMEEAGGVQPDMQLIRRRLGNFHVFSAQIKNRPLVAGSTWWSADQLGSFDIVAPDSKDGQLCGLSTIAYFDGGERQTMRISDGEISITYDPAHGSSDPKASMHAITVEVRTPADTFALVGAWAGRPEDPLMAIRELVAIIHRFKAPRVRVGIEAVGYQNTIRHILWRELNTPYWEGKPNDKKGVKCTWLHPDKHIIPIRRPASEGDKPTWNRDTLGPVIQSGALLVNPSVPFTDMIVMAIESCPVKKAQDFIDSLTMHAGLWKNVPRSANERRKLLFLQRQRLLERRRAGTSYGWGIPSRPDASKL